EREFDRVGGRGPIRVNVRILAATNRDLESAVSEGRFREDLYHRLNVIPISLPPLRERSEDIPALAEYFLRRYAAEAKKNFVDVSAEAQVKLMVYGWPGNVRELANVIERAVVLGNGPSVVARDLPGRIAAAEGQESPSGLSYRDALEAARREVVTQALGRSGGNRTAAAKSLGLHEKYFLRLIKTLRIG
ncbi:MAG TPA: sigma 54-interacting transcriptional regulator, partial [Candidatus Binatia bacterium]|nr:sigma 54-interacting transcriptional regulator [Candidatus Binatia bacterium]